ncbi:MAG TPA: tripartite tricarboxylate transporter substrate-binding protein [Xanthobacteraceae bacterium]|jgi:tripartite-type tricarboxylate transporter receptor subunit TctC|nr:tripartite tricarboxylate transporter substrate-binding protein [Xanthobacteraceae bacterium]
MRKGLLGLTAAAVFALSPAASRATDESFSGKTITILVGFGPGGGYDLYSRIVARFLPDHIPGHPTVIVSNMGQAGGLRAANNVAVVAPKDGTEIACVNASLLPYQMLGGKNARFDATKLQWLISATHSNNSIITWHTSGIKTIDDAKKQEVPFGTGGPASTSYIYPAVANAVISTKFKLIAGYTGSNSLDLAMEKGEIAGHSGANLNSLFARNAEWIRDKKINFLVQIGFERDKSLPDVPVLGELTTTEKQKQIVDLATLPTAIGYAYWVAPEVPHERVSILQKAFAAVIADPEFKKQVEQAGFDVVPTGPDKLTALVKAAAATPEPVKKEAAALLAIQ